MLSFKPTFSLSSFTFIKRLKRVVSSAYLRLLIFLPAIFIPACASFSPAFQMMYSAYKLNQQGDNIKPWQTPFPIWNQSVVPCPVLTVASWPAYRYLRRQVRSSSKFCYVHFTTIKNGGSYGTKLQKRTQVPHGQFIPKSRVGGFGPQMHSFFIHLQLRGSSLSPVGKGRQKMERQVKKQGSWSLCGGRH